jgi:hypothetical protein
MDEKIFLKIGDSKHDKHDLGTDHPGFPSELKSWRLNYYWFIII